jgi:hypothetical protein
MVADEMFRDFLASHAEQRRDSYRRRMLLRERLDLRKPVDRKIQELRCYDAETERLRRQIGARHVGLTGSLTRSAG